ncbi:MAG: Fe-S cluster assembly ATPase SufC [Patescibacteria group bacterium]|nr:Fe-S cluster assembly ATPase SufC [Patescibacteria group bacterium]
MPLTINNLKVSVEHKLILKGVSLEVLSGETVALMGPNGSGKSSLAYCLGGHPNYQVEAGKMKLDGKEINKLAVDERAKLGLFLGLQYPVGVSGVHLTSFLRLAYQKVSGKKLVPFEFRKLIQAKAKRLNLEPTLLERAINEGFSGGEKKKTEVLQLMVLQPKYAILDEIDSGLDIDALKMVAKAVNQAKKDNPGLGVLLITHYQRILDYIKPDRVLVMKGGRIVKQGDRSLVKELEKNGYAGI